MMKKRLKRDGPPPAVFIGVGDDADIVVRSDIEVYWMPRDGWRLHNTPEARRQVFGYDTRWETLPLWNSVCRSNLIARLWSDDAGLISRRWPINTLATALARHHSGLTGVIYGPVVLLVHHDGNEWLETIERVAGERAKLHEAWKRNLG